MARLTLELDPDTAERLRRAAEREGLTQTQWVTDLIQHRLADAWPQAFRDLAGAWSDLPEADDLRRGTGDDLPREPF